MTTRSHPLLIPQCSNCIRRLVQTGVETPRSPFTQQIRGKTRLSKKNQPDTIPVKLIANVPKYGKKGAIIPITLGQMRNSFLPRRFAVYLTEAQIEELKGKNIVPERDYSFGVVDKSKHREEAAKKAALPAPAPVKEPAPAPKPKPVELEMLSPERSMELIEILVPKRIDFYRTPIEGESEPESQPKPRAASAAAADLAAATMGPPKPKPVPIYGSVATPDIADSIKAVLAENDEAARVVLTDEDIKFVGPPGVDAIRVKHLGEYEVQIQVRGAAQPVRREVRVIAQGTQLRH